MEQLYKQWNWAWQLRRWVRPFGRWFTRASVDVISRAWTISVRVQPTPMAAQQDRRNPWVLNQPIWHLPGYQWSQMWWELRFCPRFRRPMLEDSVPGQMAHWLDFRGHVDLRYTFRNCWTWCANCSLGHNFSSAQLSYIAKHRRQYRYSTCACTHAGACKRQGAHQQLTFSVPALIERDLIKLSKVSLMLIEYFYFNLLLPNRCIGCILFGEPGTALDTLVMGTLFFTLRMCTISTLRISTMQHGNMRTLWPLRC